MITRTAGILMGIAAVFAVSGVRADPPNSAAKSSYHSMSFADFMIDAPILASRHAKVEISGIYARKGQAQVLYGNSQSLALDNYYQGPRAGLPTPQVIGLITDSARRELRASAYDCDTNHPGGCWMTVRGRADSCTAVNSFGAPISIYCIDATDGELSSPSGPQPPTADQIEHSTAVADAWAKTHCPPDHSCVVPAYVTAGDVPPNARAPAARTYGEATCPAGDSACIAAADADAAANAKDAR